MRRSKTKDCPNCGDPHSGPGDLCPDCRPALSPPHPLGRGGLCPWCKQALDLSAIQRMERCVGPTVEVVYYCAYCRAFLEVASWMEEKAPGD